tara:strand:+ start:358 stop:2328 length:1971 start_codon:yes stop_codon:yes gene_type:complete
MRFEYNAINKLPKKIYDSKIITALTKIRDNQAPGMMGGGSLLPVLPGLPEVGNIVPAPTNTTADPLNGMSASVSSSINNRIINNYEPILDSIDEEETPIDSNNKTLTDILKKLDDANRDLLNEVSKDADGNVELDDLLTDEFLGNIIKNSRFPEMSIDAMRTYLLNNAPYTSINSVTAIAKKKLRSLKDASPADASPVDGDDDETDVPIREVEEKHIDLRITLTSLFLGELVVENGLENTMTNRIELRAVLIENAPYSSIDDIRSKAKEIIDKLREDADDVSTPSSGAGNKDASSSSGAGDGAGDDVRPADPSFEDQLIPSAGSGAGNKDAGGSLFALQPGGTISRRSVTGEQEILMDDGSWEPLHPISGVVHTGGGLRYKMQRDRFGQWIIPSQRPPGMSEEEWETLRKKTTDENEKKRKKPIPPLPPTKPIPKDKPEDPPFPPGDPREKQKRTARGVDGKINLGDKNRKLGISALRPFFSTYHGIDLLTQTDKEAIEDIREFDIFDLPIPDNDDLENPLFVHNLQQQSLRFSGAGNPVNANQPSTIKSVITSEILQTNIDGGLMLERLHTETIYIDRGIPTQNPLEIVNQHSVPTIMGGLKDGVPFKDPNTNKYDRGFGKAERTVPSYTESIMDSLYENPDIYNSLIAIRDPFD